jgi:hypothetical protein
LYLAIIEGVADAQHLSRWVFGVIVDTTLQQVALAARLNVKPKNSHQTP